MRKLRTKEELLGLIAEAKSPDATEENLRSLWQATTSTRVRKAIIQNPSAPIAFFGEPKVFPSMLETIAETGQVELILLLADSNLSQKVFKGSQQQFLEFVNSVKNDPEGLIKSYYYMSSKAVLKKGDLTKVEVRSSPISYGAERVGKSLFNVVLDKKVSAEHSLLLTTALLGRLEITNYSFSGASSRWSLTTNLLSGKNRVKRLHELAPEWEKYPIGKQLVKHLSKHSMYTL